MGCNCDGKRVELGGVSYDGYQGFFEDANAAMAQNPGYFSFWDTLKTVGLVAASAGLVIYATMEKKRGR